MLLYDSSFGCCNEATIILITRATLAQATRVVNYSILVLGLTALDMGKVSSDN